MMEREREEAAVEERTIAGDEAAREAAMTEEAVAEESSAADPSALEASSKRLRSILESLLFAAGDPVSLGRLCQLVPGYERRDVARTLAEIAEECAREQRGFRLQEVAGGWQLRTSSANAEFVRRLLAQRPVRLTRAALETLAVVAYRQPVTRPEIEAIRGVDVDAVLTTLLERRLVRVLGRKDVVGRPLLYGTTPTFLETFGLKDLAALPRLEEIGASADALERAAQAAEASVVGDVPSEAEASTEEPPAIDAVTDAAPHSEPSSTEEK
jgi:segregation and condensation protein B